MSRGTRSGGAFVIAALALAAALAPLTGSAADEADEAGQITWAIQPSSPEGPDGRDVLEYSLGPGETATDYVGVSNLGAEPLVVRVYAMDALMTADGAFSLPPAGTASEDVGAWVGITGDGVFTIEPGTRAEIPFRLTVPPNAEPGDHAGGIVASLAELSETAGADQQVAVDRRVGVRLYVDVPGVAAPAATVSDIDVAYEGGFASFGGPATVTYTVENPGNLRLGGLVRIALTGPFGWELAAGEPQELPELLPGGSVRLTQEFADVPPAVLLTATADLEPVQREGRSGAVDGEHRAVGTAWAVPWLLLVVLLALIAVVVLLVRRGILLRRRLRAAEAAVAAAQTADAGDGVDSDAPEPGIPEPAAAR
ncbi:DUF916 domain-containing protein [Agromyces seonyuensis]|uniref:DUF916 domain-containing protein n=1 Tax=Agromyces seonyuensis TaxID=2662446 RepID=A0A6I4NYU6_9MICO|nr:DUF916 domain-containing protein [Agromyces seonyuensis]MWB97605.1 DUF916 domain-containing protein [Agromyces seonyuensis]